MAAPGERMSSIVGVTRNLVLLAAVGLLAGGGLYLALGSGGSASPALSTHGASVKARAHASSGGSRPAGAPSAAAPPAAPPPHLLVSAPAHAGSAWTVIARVHGTPAAWLAQRSGVTLMRFEQTLVRLDLHAGSSDGGSEGWVYGDHINAKEIHLVLAAFNGGFKLTYADVGFMSAGRVAVALKSGLASIVTYTDGTTAIGAWREGVPSSHNAVFSVLQNQRLLVDRGRPAATVSSCVIACWGETIGSRTSVARSALALTASGQLLWAAGEQLEPAELAGALIEAGAVRAVELDINPDWVAGYVYVHHAGGPAAVPVVPGQVGIAGRLLEPDSRDFLTVVAN